MPHRTLRVDQPLSVVWDQLQQLESWEGIGGMGQLREPKHRSDGSLASFAYSLDTPVGTVDDTAAVTASRRRPGALSMDVVTETKGLRVTIALDLVAADDTTDVDFSIDAEATNFLTKPLASTLRHTLDSGMTRESDRMVERLERRSTDS